MNARADLVRRVGDVVGALDGLDLADTGTVLALVLGQLLALPSVDAAFIGALLEASIRVRDRVQEVAR